MATPWGHLLTTMVINVLASHHDLQIGGVIILTISVAMMHYLTQNERSTKGAFYDQAMFQDVATQIRSRILRHSNENVTLAVQGAASVPISIQRAALIAPTHSGAEFRSSLRGFEGGANGRQASGFLQRSLLRISPSSYFSKLFGGIDAMIGAIAWNAIGLQALFVESAPAKIIRRLRTMALGADLIRWRRSVVRSLLIQRFHGASIIPY